MLVVDVGVDVVVDVGRWCWSSVSVVGVGFDFGCCCWLLAGWLSGAWVGIVVHFCLTAQAWLAQNEARQTVCKQPVARW